MPWRVDLDEDEDVEEIPTIVAEDGPHLLPAALNEGMPIVLLSNEESLPPVWDFLPLQIPSPSQSPSAWFPSTVDNLRD